jgi:predicted ATPase
MKRDDSILVILSGGPGAGKTTMLEELSRRGYRCVDEVAREIIREQMTQGGRALPWGDREAYARLMLSESIASYLEHAEYPGLTFFDRGVPDTLAYIRLMGLGLEQENIEACSRYRYWRQVFLAPPWAEIYETDSERRQPYEEAVRTYGRMIEVYSECGYECVELPKSTAPLRADFILSTLRDLSEA